LLATEVWEMPTEPKATAVRAGARRVAAMPAIASLFPYASSSCFSLRNNTNNASPITHERSFSLSCSLALSLPLSRARALSSLLFSSRSLDVCVFPWITFRGQDEKEGDGCSSVRPSVRPGLWIPRTSLLQCFCFFLSKFVMLLKVAIIHK
jgi:hypothetical protein